MATTIIYDEDFDLRIFEAIDILIKKGFLPFDTTFSEHEGQLFIETPYENYLNLHEKMIDLDSGDSWIIFVTIT